MIAAEFYAVKGMRGLVSLLACIQEGSRTGKLPETVRRKA
jgi:hypothetical protein